MMCLLNSSYRINSATTSKAPLLAVNNLVNINHGGQWVGLGFLSLGVGDIGVQRILCGGGGPVPCGTVHSIPGLHPLDAGSVAPG